MKQRWAPGFTIVELLIVVVVIAILVTITVVSYTNITRSTIDSAAKAHLVEVAAEMRLGLLDTKAFPTSLSTKLATNGNVTTQLKTVGAEQRYTNLTPVQNGTLFSVICQNLIDSGAGRANDQGGTPQDYITGCSNWNYNKVQIGGWVNQVWNTPVTAQQLRDYGNSFTTNVAYQKPTHEATVKSFYNTLADTFIRRGGTTPITSFWDYWASPSSGGVYAEALPDGTASNYYCAEAQSIKQPDIIWHVTETNTVVSGPC